MPNCNEYQEMISRLLDDELSAEEAQLLHAHISECDECRRLYDAFSAVSGAIAGDMEDVPEELTAGIMFKVRAAAAPKKKRFKISHYAALAACLAVVILAASRSNLFHGGAKEMAPMAPDAAMSMQSKTAPADSESYPAPMPETAMDMLCDAEAELCVEDDSAYGYSAHAEESGSLIMDDADGGIAMEPLSPEAPEEAPGFEMQTEALFYNGARYEFVETVSALPEGAIYIATAESLFNLSFSAEESAVYTLENDLYIHMGPAQYALYRK